MSRYTVRPSDDHPGMWIVWDESANRQAVGTVALLTERGAKTHARLRETWEIEERENMYRQGRDHGVEIALRSTPEELGLNVAHYTERAALKDAAYERGILDGLMEAQQ